MVGISRRNHYVPQFYLEPWTSPPDGMVWRYSRVHSGRLDERRIAPKATGFEFDLYSAVDGVGGCQRPDSIERAFFGPIDNAAAGVHEKLASGSAEKLSDHERLAWARFLSSLLERDPGTLESNDQRAEPLAEEVAAEMLARCRPESREEIAEVLTPELKATIVKYVVRSHMVKEIDAPDVLRYMHLANGETERAIRLLELHGYGNMTATEPSPDRNIAS